MSYVCYRTNEENVCDEFATHDDEYVHDDVDEKIKNAENAESGKDNDEMTDVDKADVEMTEEAKGDKDRGFWKTKESMFPILSRMARDMLSVQATSDHLDAQDRIQNTSSLEHSLDFEEDILEVEVQDNEAIPLSDKEITLDEASSEAMSNRSGSRGEDVDLTLSESD
ncbi:zinc finger BED domain-containing protein RICESLEEPER 2 [Tanacetum coccineum]